MRRGAPLPVLPGFNFDTRIGQTKFHKPQHFGRIHTGVYYLSEKAKCGIGGKPLPFVGHDRYPALYPRGEVQALPPWLAFDNQRLMFKAYFQETVQERWQSPFQIRVVTISFFLEDGTIKISEPQVDNSGLEQGVLVRRQRIPMPDPVRYRYYDILDLNIGKEPEFFARVYKIVDCDKFTRRFLNRCGIPVPDPIEIPRDPYNERRKVEVFSKKPNRKMDTLAKFLSNDRKVLRFYGYWDDTGSTYGVMHDLELHFYLSDDTIEIKENIPPNSGRDTGLVFIKRMKLPKDFSKVDAPGAADPFTILNVLGENTSSSWYIVDSLNTGISDREFYQDKDLMIGAEINVFGRKVVLTDMDPYTREYYRVKFGIDDFTPLERPDIKKESECKPVEKYVPPYNGYGSYEDSLGNCFSIEPRPPKIDFVKFYEHDKQGFESHVLRFRAKLISNIPENNDRHFIIRVFLTDNTISIFELAVRNSGFKRCLFQKRMEVMMPQQDIYTNKKPKYYEPHQFYIGARVNLNGFNFQITSADIYALRYMEIHCNQFPKANMKLIMEKLRKALKPVYKKFLQENYPVSPECESPVVEYKNLRGALCKYLGDQITEHEMITLARYYSSHEKKERHTREYIRSLVHGELTRQLWTDVERLEEDLHHVDRARTGYLPRDELYTIIRGCRLALDIELLNSMLDHLCKNEEGKIDYNDLLQFIDVKQNPVMPTPPINVKSALWWASEKEPDCGAGVDWCRFLADLDIKEEDCEPMLPAN
ncbi:EF-hand domain-containing family member C2-like [Athalia rosae]|uniref:EF-hand domain-containing family member C2-like n=1 Tax=Athalia rosae TaxID=37344 RepID=UPI00203404FD|nr:EF-hand domain-containing family member C2-like [Athalia rosae]XP_020710115.2 EF-hand domain-containing family member C2-like [Athalia rosae]XP_020710116.2 EF-hand domain-containing family member C2-like [Athalia rosae]XP_048514432.1 EF-hand domain-containing family member C2-like [Athalia rosae]XP_048514433.1 EF-hand domain-containing family member C2-like [Athalia rosae]XP_048514434.1 EF-hand domain-containing family member C2-like [Athalia rosae]XP_048514435.1 EF-hand domain-containing 